MRFSYPLQGISRIIMKSRSPKSDQWTRLIEEERERNAKPNGKDAKCSSAVVVASLLSGHRLLRRVCWNGGPKGAIYVKGFEIFFSHGRPRVRLDGG